MVVVGTEESPRGCGVVDVDVVRFEGAAGGSAVAIVVVVRSEGASRRCEAFALLVGMTDFLLVRDGIL